MAGGRASVRGIGEIPPPASRYRRSVTDYQRIFVVSTQIRDDEVTALRKRLGKAVTVLTAPTGEAKRVVRGVGHEATPDVTLAPERFPDVDRGHRLDALVRRHALADRQRDIVVVADPATVTLLLRVTAPGQLPERGPVTMVSLPRAAAPVSLVHVAAGGVALAVLTGLLVTILPFWVLPGLVVLVGLALLPVPRHRRTGQTLLLATGAAAVVGMLAIAGSARFPGSW